MILADGLAIGAGLLLHQRLPERLLHFLASLLFLLFGLWMLFDGALGWRWVAIGATAAIGLTAATVAAAQTLRRRRKAAAGRCERPQRRPNGDRPAPDRARSSLRAARDPPEAGYVVLRRAL